MWHLAKAYAHQYDKSGALKDLEAKLEKQAAAVELTPTRHPDRAHRLQMLAASHIQRYRELGKLADVEAALPHLQESVKLSADDEPDLHQRIEGLAVVFSYRFERLGKLEDLDAALNNGEAAILLAPEGYPDLPARLQDLAMSFADRYGRKGDPQDLELSLEKSKQAMMLMPPGHPELPGHLEGLSHSLIDRYKIRGDLTDLDAALEHNQTALMLTSKNHPDYPRRLHTFAISLGLRYDRYKDVEDLDAALQNTQEAVDRTWKGHLSFPGYLTTLGQFYNTRYQRTNHLPDLEAALKSKQSGVELTSEDDPALPGRLQAWALTLSARYTRLKSLDDLQNALKQNQLAVDMTPKDHPDLPRRLQSLAIIFSERYTKFRNAQDLESVSDNFRRSFRMATSAPVYAWRTALQWASFAKKHRPAEQLEAYSAAFRLLSEILWMGNSLNANQDATTRINIAQATSAAVCAGVELGDTPLAIKLLEQGLATTFQQLLQLKVDDVAGLPEADVNQLRMLSAKLYSGTAERPQLLAVQRNELLQKIRRRPGFKTFLLPKPYPELCEAAKNGPVVILSSHRAHCDALILLSPALQPCHVSLPSITLADLEAQRTQLRNVLDRCNITARDTQAARLEGAREGSDSESIQESFRELLAWLWTHIVGQVYENGFLEGRLWWCPTGAFTGLPLHAAAPSDQFVQSYTSTLSALLTANSKKTSGARPKVGAIGVTYTGPRQRAALPSVAQEINAIVSILGRDSVHTLVGEAATVAAVTEALHTCSWVHLACHGRQDLADPPKSCLRLYGGTLELGTVLRTPLPHAELVFLAACQTAMGDAALVNEAFHLAGGFVTAGFRGAVATMWSMMDGDGPVVAEAVYARLFGNGRVPQVTDAAEALQAAVRKMREEGVPYERWVPFVHLGA
ncbi:CHAT domain-containing protein [Mycena latifolia]|nr:CHAT domain-containing protein [Mycena latifolia]